MFLSCRQNWSRSTSLQSKRNELLYPHSRKKACALHFPDWKDTRKLKWWWLLESILGWLWKNIFPSFLHSLKKIKLKGNYLKWSFSASSFNSLSLVEQSFVYIHFLSAMCIKSSSLSKDNSSISVEDALPIETDRLSTRVPFHFPIMMVRIQKQRGQTPVFLIWCKQRGQTPVFLQFMVWIYRQR